MSVYLEVVLHMTLAVIFVGADGGFQVTLIGMNAHLSKPVESEHLFQTLGELIYEAEEEKATE